MGIGREAGPLTIVGMIMGLSYGGGMITHEAHSGRIASKDVFASLSLMGLAHAVFEDTLLLAVLGGHVSGLLWARVVFALIVIAILARVVERLGEGFFIAICSARRIWPRPCGRVVRARPWPRVGRPNSRPAALASTLSVVVRTRGHPLEGMFPPAARFLSAFVLRTSGSWPRHRPRIHPRLISKPWSESAGVTIPARFAPVEPSLFSGFPKIETQGFPVIGPETLGLL